MCTGCQYFAAHLLCHTCFGFPLDSDFLQLDKKCENLTDNLRRGPLSFGVVILAGKNQSKSRYCSQYVVLTLADLRDSHCIVESRVTELSIYGRVAMNANPGSRRTAGTESRREERN
jgi:hypothetical protein